MNKPPKKTHPDPLVQPDLTIQEERKFWLEKGRELISRSPETLDDVAKQIISISSILEGLYFSSITFSNLHTLVKSTSILFICLLPLFLILGSIIASLFVFFPNRYLISMSSSDAAKEIYEDIIRRKWKFLLCAGILLVISVILLIGVVAIYLTAQ